MAKPTGQMSRRLFHYGLFFVAFVCTMVSVQTAFAQVPMLVPLKDTGQHIGDGVRLDTITTDIKLGDLDGDGDLDAVIADVGNGAAPGSDPRDPHISTWLNDGNGYFTFSGFRMALAGSAGPGFGRGLSLGDLNGDGRLDVLSVGVGEPPFVNPDRPDVVLLGLGNGFFVDTGQNLVLLPAYSGSVDLGDLDGDGDLDFGIANFFGRLEIWMNDGTGQFSNDCTVSGGASEGETRLGDVDGDGDLDFIAAQTSYAIVSVNNGTCDFSVGGQLAPWAAGDRIQGSGLLDVDGDGDLDALASPISSPMTLHVSNGDFVTNQVLSNGIRLGSNGSFMQGTSQFSQITTGDINADGRTDVAFGGYGLWLNDPDQTGVTGTFVQTAFPAPCDGVPITGRIGAIELGDLDGDGDLDMFVSVRDNGSGPNKVWLQETGSVACGEPVTDSDGDGFSPPDDCDDDNAAINPDAPEILCNGVDENCNGLADDDQNADGDPVSFCSGDCNDTNPGMWPGNAETLCNGVDDNCNGLADDDQNADGDPVSLCNGDCDDADSGNYPGNSEGCDGQDNDCDLVADEGFDADDDGLADCFDDCPFDADNDIDGDEVCGDLDNCPDDANPDQTDFDGDGAGDACTACVPDGRSQGYWHRQCLGVPASEGGIDPGRNGRGPQEPLEVDFDKDMAAVSLRLGEFFEFDGSCAGGMDAIPASDKCEKALKQSTALLFNLVTSKLSGSCQVDLAAEGCSSTNLTDLVGELEGLINSGDDGNCQIAAACATAVNEGAVTLESTVPVVEATEAPAVSTVTNAPAPAPAGPGSVAAVEEEGVAGFSAPAEAWVPEARELTVAPLVPQVEALDIKFADTPETEAPAEPEDDLQAMQRHLAVIGNPSAPESALEVSTDALLTMLSGGYEPELRLEIVQRLLSRIDVGYHRLLAGHVQAIRAEAKDSGMEELAREAARVLRQLEPTEE